MAGDSHHASEYTDSGAGTMDLRDHMKTWLAFWAGVKWSAVGLILVAVLLAVFRTHN